MASGIYAIAHVGHMKLYIGDASCIKSSWPPIMAQLNSGIHPNAALQQVWNQAGGKRCFTFHTYQDLISKREIIGIEQLTLDLEKV